MLVTFRTFTNKISSDTVIDILMLQAQLFKGRLSLNPGLNLTRVSFSCVQKHFLG